MKNIKSFPQDNRFLFLGIKRNNISWWQHDSNNKIGNEAEIQHQYDNNCVIVKDAYDESAVFQADISVTVTEITMLRLKKNLKWKQTDTNCLSVLG